MLKIKKSFVLFKEKLKPNIPIYMIWVEPGRFKMGSAIGQITEVLEPQFTVALTQGFWLSKHLVTQKQWQLVMGTKRTEALKFYETLGFGQENVPNYPMTHVDWDDAMSFCNVLNQKWLSKVPNDYIFSLPTSAQWEYACRAGTDSLYHSGSTIEDLSRVAWHGENSSNSMHPVGEKEPNNWGFYDMHGSVFEWCYDPYSGYPSRDYAVDWVGQGNDIVRILRGGDYWKHPPSSEYFFCASHKPVDCNEGAFWTSFRLCLRPIIEM